MAGKEEMIIMKDEDARATLSLDPESGLLYIVHYCKKSTLEQKHGYWHIKWSWCAICKQPFPEGMVAIRDFSNCGGEHNQPPGKKVVYDQTAELGRNYP